MEVVSILSKLKFKILTEQLTDDAFDKLLSKFRQQIGREQMLKLICDGSSESQLNALKAEILPIMQQMKPNKAEADPTTSTASNKHSITTLPTAMIGEIASYLDQKAYARLSTTNRKIFVDCNSPNRLVALDLNAVEDYNFISLRNYQHLLSLEFVLAHIDNFEYRLIPRCHRLQTLMISGSPECIPDELTRFIADIDGPLTGVTTLSLYGFDWVQENPLPPELFVQLLTLFPALTHLELHSVEFTDHLDTALLADCCPSLNRLSMHCVKYDTSFLNAYGGQITTLSLLPRFEDCVPPNLDYCKLRRLCLYAPSEDTMEGFLKTSYNLEEICFFPMMRKFSLSRGTTEDDQPMTDSEIKQMTKNLIVDSQSLRLFHVSTRGHFENICDSIQKGLYCTKERDREFMEIGLTVDCREIEDIDDFMCSISQIMVAMTQSKTEKWILSLEPDRHRSFEMDQESWEKAVSVLMTSYKTVNVKLLFVGEWKLVFGSEGCSFMNTHRDWWNDC